MIMVTKLFENKMSVLSNKLFNSMKDELCDEKKKTLNNFL